jgi:hypothetical protein
VLTLSAGMNETFKKNISLEVSAELRFAIQKDVQL